MKICKAVNSNDVFQKVMEALGSNYEDGVTKLIITLEIDKPVGLEVTKKVTLETHYNVEIN